MQRQYEIVYIFDSTLDEDQINGTLERLHEVLKTPEISEPITAQSHWGKRTLAYQIRGKEVGYYVIVRADTDPTTLGELERLIKLDETILRYLIVVSEGLAPIGADTPSDEAAAETSETPAAAATDTPAAAEATPATAGDDA